MEEVRLPQRWQDWSLTERIGSGSFGTVYKAERKTGQASFVSAIKIGEVPPQTDEAEKLMREMRSEESVQDYYRDMVEGYLSEIRTMDSLKGISNIVSIEDYCVEKQENGVGWTLYIRMEYLTSFNDYSAEHELSEEEIIRLGIDICTALSYCEKMEIIHRDIKPDNIFVSRLGQFKLGDFGVARRLDRTVGSYSAKGTFTYMAPEVYKGEKYGNRADLYSLGMVLYRLCNRNRDPFVDPDKQMVYYKDRENALKRRMEGEKLPDPIQASPERAKIILKACMYEQKERYSSAGQLKKDLEKLYAIRLRQSERAAELDRTLVPGDMPLIQTDSLRVSRRVLAFMIPAGAAVLLAAGFLLGKGNLISGGETPEMLKGDFSELITESQDEVFAGEAQIWTGTFESGQFEQCSYTPEADGGCRLTLATDEPGSQVHLEIMDEEGRTKLDTYSGRFSCELDLKKDMTYLLTVYEGPQETGFQVTITGTGESEQTTGEDADNE